MSVEFDLKDNGMIRVRVDREGERAVSDEMDPKEMMQEIADAAGWDTEFDEGELIIQLPQEPETEEPTEPAENPDETEPAENPDETEPAENPDETEPAPSQIDESAPPEEPSA
jgi:hypothetical protein